MEDLNPTNPEPTKAELEAAVGTMYHSREMQREAYEQNWGAEETLPLDESEEQSPPEGTEDANP